MSNDNDSQCFYAVLTKTHHRLLPCCAPFAWPEEKEERKALVDIFQDQLLRRLSAKRDGELQVDESVYVCVTRNQGRLLYATPCVSANLRSLLEGLPTMNDANPVSSEDALVEMSTHDWFQQIQKEGATKHFKDPQVSAMNTDEGAFFMLGVSKVVMVRRKPGKGFKIASSVSICRRRKNYRS